MSVCIIAIVGKKTRPENFLEFYETLRKTIGDYFLCVVNSSSERFREIETLKNINVIQNNIDPGYVTSINQGLYFSLSSGFKYTVSINADYSLVADGDWLNNALKSFSETDGIGGTIYPVKITNSDVVKRILYSIDSSGDISWFSKWLNRYMVTSFIDSNIFMVSNKSISGIKLPDSNFCDASSYGLALSLIFMNKGIPPVNIKSIYSSPKDYYRFDIFSIINNGVGIIHPVSIDSVRNRFVN